MMKSIITLVFFCVALCTKAQITIDQTDMPKADSIYYRALASNFAQQNFATAGANQSWDFSSLDSTASTAESYFSILKAPLTALFTFGPIAPSITRSQMFKSGGNPINTGGAGGGALPINVDSTFEYYKLSSSRFARTGLSINLNGFPVPLPYDSNDVVFKLPMTFNQVDSSLSIFELDIPFLDFLYYKSRTKRVNQVDGWGTLKLPNNPATYDVLRVKSNLTIADTISVDTTITVAGFPLPLTFGFNLPVRREVEYKWLTKGKGLPILTVSGIEFNGAFTVNEVRYLYTPTPVGINDVEKKSISLYPNPTQGNFTIESDKLITQVSITNILGKEIYSQNVSNKNKIILQAPNTSGIYFVQVLMEDGVVMKEVLKVE